MPTIYDLELLPVRGQTSREPTPYQIHGLVCGLLAEDDEQHSAQEKLWSIRPPAVLGKGWQIQVVWHSDLATPPVREAGDGSVRLGAIHYEVVSLTSTRLPLQALMLGSADRADLEFVTPAWFSRSGSEYPLPDARLIYRGLGLRWAAIDQFGSLLAPEALEEVAGQVRITRFSGETRQFQLGKARRTGFVGRARYALPRGSDSRVREAFGALTQLAPLVGVGAMTTHGAGCVEVEVG